MTEVDKIVEQLREQCEWEDQDLAAYLIVRLRHQIESKSKAKREAFEQLCIETVTLSRETERKRCVAIVTDLLHGDSPDKSQLDADIDEVLVLAINRIEAGDE